MTHMVLVCLYGAPGVGKLSVGRLLQEMTGYVFIHDHLTIETAAAVFPFASPGFAELRSSLFSALLDAACATRRGIIVTHADDVFWEPSFAAILKDRLRRYAYREERVFLQCAEAEHARRIVDPQRSRYQKIADMDRLKRLVKAGEFAPLAPRGQDLLIDTTHSSPADVAEQIALALQLIPRAVLRAG